MNLLPLRKEDNVMFIPMPKNPVTVIRYLCFIWAKYFSKKKTYLNGRHKLKNRKRCNTFQINEN